MKELFLLRGIPASGKSTWIHEHNLERYTLSSDTLRLLYSAPVLNPYGDSEISTRDNKKMWDTFNDMLINRMENGETVFIDSTNTTRKEINKYCTMGKPFGYHINCIDFSDVSLSEAKTRNMERESLRRVPDFVMDKMYNNLQNNLELPLSVRRILPDEFDKCLICPVDLSDYDKIHVIGDIHGCYTALSKYLEDGIKDNEYYIFIGDYLDRGIENVNTINYLMSIMDKKNVCFLEGNHEVYLRSYVDNKKTCSETFEKKTRIELEHGGVKRKKLKAFCKNLKPCKYYTYKDKTFLVCHGGISNIPGNLLFVSAYQLIHGTGEYSDYKITEESFDERMPDNFYQIHGHRNTENSSVHSSERCYNLEGAVEHGKYLRALNIDKTGIHEIEIKNDVYQEAPKREEEITGNIWDFTAKKINPVEQEIQTAKMYLKKERNSIKTDMEPEL